MADEARDFAAWKCHSVGPLARTQSGGFNLTTKGGEISSSSGPNNQREKKVL